MFRRLMGIVVIVLAAVSLSGCTGGSSVPFGSTLFTPKSYSLAPIVGAPPKVSTQMTQAMVQAGQAHGITIVPNGESEPLTIRGFLVARRERQGSTISYIWDVNNANGKRVNRISGEQKVPRRGSDPWGGVGSTEIRTMADIAVTKLAGGGGAGATSAPTTTSSTTAPAAESGGSSGGGFGDFFSRNFGSSGSGGTAASSPTVAAAPAATTAPATTLVAPVRGAPGDGGTSLSNALSKQLSAKGVSLARSKGRNTYTVQGVVSVKPASGGRETVRIDWKVLSPSGQQVGVVSQENKISKGSLSGPWGAIADAAAGAAVDGIVKLLPNRRG